MADRPILFSAPMVRAILARQKTQTRRAVKMDRWRLADGGQEFSPPTIACSYGQPGDRLWVREAYRLCAEADGTKPRDTDASYRIWYEADAPHQPGAGKLRPGMFMPRWASRITLEVTGVRVERLQDISEADAAAEGIERSGECNWRDYLDHPHNDFTSARRSYRSLWEQINGAGAWDANPWVWVVEFKRVQP